MARPRSARAHADVLEAAVALFAERGIDATSMDAIADAAGVSKATIYKHWPDKDALCLEALLRVHGRDTVPPDVDSGDLRADLVAVLSHEPPPQYAELRQRLMPHLMAYAARNARFGETWRARILEPPRVQLTRTITRAQRRGQLPRSLSVELAIALLLGPILYRYVFKPVKPDTADTLRGDIVDSFLRAYARPAHGSAATASRQRQAQTRVVAVTRPLGGAGTHARARAGQIAPWVPPSASTTTD